MQFHTVLHNSTVNGKRASKRRKLGEMGNKRISPGWIKINLCLETLWERKGEWRVVLESQRKPALLRKWLSLKTNRLKHFTLLLTTGFHSTDVASVTTNTQIAICSFVNLPPADCQGKTCSVFIEGAKLVSEQASCALVFI